MKHALAVGLAVGALLSGCGRASFDVDVYEQSPVPGISVISLANGAELGWTEPAETGGEPLVATFVSVHVSPPDVRSVPATTNPLVVTGLRPGLEYVVQLTTAGGRPISPVARTLPFPSGALDPVPFFEDSDDTPLASFGASVTFTADLDNDTHPDLAVGAPGTTVTSALEGAVYVYSGDQLFEGTVPKQILGGLPLGMFGAYLAPSEDFDDDGFADLLASSPNPFPLVFTDTAATPAGVVHLIEGGDGLGAVAVGPSFTGLENDSFGTASLGRDLDGDDRAELWIGGPGADSVSLVSATTSLSLSLTLTSDSATKLGYAVTSGDYDGDGRIDLVVSEPLFSTIDPDDQEPTGEPTGPVGTIGLMHQGRLRVLRQITDGVFDVTTLVGTTGGAMLGTSLTTARIDGDAFDDLIAGASPCAFPAAGSSSFAPGAIHIWLGGSDGFAAAPDRVLSAGTLCLGRNVAAGDVNQDGFTDIVTGDSSAGDQGNGELRVFLGDPSGFPSPDSSAIQGGIDASLGSSISVGDLDEDGRSEVFAGAPGSGDLVAGKVFLFRGAPRRGPDVTLGVSNTGLQVSATGTFLPQEGPEVRYTCRWTWGDGESVEEECDPGSLSSQSHAYALPGTYDVRVRVFSAKDRYGEAVVRVVVPAP